MSFFNPDPLESNPSISLLCKTFLFLWRWNLPTGHSNDRGQHSTPLSKGWIFLWRPPLEGKSISPCICLYLDSTPVKGLSLVPRLYLNWTRQAICTMYKLPNILTEEESIGFSMTQLSPIFWFRWSRWLACVSEVDKQLVCSWNAEEWWEAGGGLYLSMLHNVLTDPKSHQQVQVLLTA